MIPRWVLQGEKGAALEGWAQTAVAMPLVVTYVAAIPMWPVEQS